MVAPLPPALKNKLAALLRIQSSDNAGERANASAAIGRLLKSNGLDWHDLTAVLLEPPPPPPPRPPPAPQKPVPTYPVTAGAEEIDSEQLVEVLDIIEASSTYLSSSSQDFLEGLRARADRYNDVRLSEKQWKWLRDLMEKTGI